MSAADDIAEALAAGSRAGAALRRLSRGDERLLMPIAAEKAYL